VDSLPNLKADQLLSIEDAALIVRLADGSPRMQHAENLVSHSNLGGMLWGGNVWPGAVGKVEGDLD